MSEDKIQKKVPEAVREKVQYVLAFGVIATMLFAVNFPPFIIIFFAIFAFFLWKVFAAPSPNGTREIFEFYLSANEILRDDERRWFGFEIQDVIGRGERIVQLMNGAPPLVYFTLGALYNRAGDHKSAVNHLAYIVENDTADEKTYLYATPELKSYVKILRKIEREPSEAPQTSAAVRALERSRRNRGKVILEESRSAVKEQEIQKAKQITTQQNAPIAEKSDAHQPFNTNNGNNYANGKEQSPNNSVTSSTPKTSRRNSTEMATAAKKKESDDSFQPRRPISELLHDIYDE